MAYRVVYSSKAKNNLADILDYICNEIDNPRYARRLLSKIDHIARTIGDYPEMFRSINLLDNLSENVRIAPINGYVMLYTVNKSQKMVTIVKIASGKSNYL